LQLTQASSRLHCRLSLKLFVTSAANLVAIGTPEEIAANPQSYTEQYLKQVFDRRRGKAKRPQAAK
jgi:hypothetical protein